MITCISHARRDEDPMEVLLELVESDNPDSCRLDIGLLYDFYHEESLEDRLEKLRLSPLIDDSIREYLIELNLIGLKTQYSCSGLYVEHLQTKCMDGLLQSRAYLTICQRNLYHDLVEILIESDWEVILKPDCVLVKLIWTNHDSDQSIRQSWSLLMSRLKTRWLL